MEKAPLFRDIPFDDVLKCVHCGLCLDACPTYRELGTEQDSPRGRLYLMRAMWEGQLQPDEETAAPLDRCLDCRACETACPSNVPYGQLLEFTRGAMGPHRHRGILERAMRALFLRWGLGSDSFLIWASRFSLFARMTGLVTAARKFSQWGLLPGWVARGTRTMPRFGGSSFKHRHAGKHAATTPTIGKVGLFTGCVMNVAETEVHRATLKLLRRAGYEVEIPSTQACCGALSVHSGERHLPRNLAERNHWAFKGVDVIVSNAAGCGAQLREYAPLFADSPNPDATRWHAFGEKVTDAMELLAATDGFLEAPIWRDDEDLVFYDTPCHLQHAQKVGGESQVFLSALPGVTLAPLTEADRCCGAAGIFNLTQGELSDKVLARKLDDLEMMLARFPQASCLLTANPGCLFQLREGCRQRDFPLKVLHPLTYLARRLMP